MSVTTLVNKQIYYGSGTTGPFTFTFRFFANSDIKVYKTVNGVQTLLTITTHYTLSGAGSANGGSITLVTALAVGEQITIIRELPLSQLVDLTNQGAFFAEVHEEVFDRLAMVAQQLKESVDRSIKLRADLTGTDPVLPIPSARKALRWNDDGTALVNSTGDADTVAAEAAASASAAATSASAADASADAAAASASSASTSATSASTSAANAASSETAAAGSASTASTQATNASNSATAAAGSASAASTSETNANTSANNASSSASTASTQATNASNSASAASTSATNASNSASAASTSATNAANSATAADASADAAAASAAEAASYVGEAHTVDGFHASQTTGASLIPVRDANGNVEIIGGMFLNQSPSNGVQIYTTRGNFPISAPGSVYLAYNAYLDATNTWRYLSTGTAAVVAFNATQVVRYTAVSGTTGDPISWTQEGIVPAVAAVPADATKVLRGDATWTQVTEAMMSLADNTTLDVSTAKHGFMPKLPNDATKFLNGVGSWVAVAGKVLQVVTASSATRASGTTTIPYDNTIPQNTEGTEFIVTPTITPKSSTSTLYIFLDIKCSVSGGYPTIALFKDSDANAIYVDAGVVAVANTPYTLGGMHAVASGSTTGRVYKVRGGPSSAATFYFCGGGAADYYGGVWISRITVMEVEA